MIKKADVEFDGPEWQSISKNAKDLLSKIITKEEKRLTLDEALNHNWFRQNIKTERSYEILTLDKIIAFNNKDFI